MVLISHSHWDHLDYGSLRLLGHATPLVVPRGMGARLRARGFGEVIEVVPGDDLTGGRPDHRGDPRAPSRVRPAHRAHGAVRRLSRRRGRARSTSRATRPCSRAWRRSTGVSAWRSSRSGAGARARGPRSISTRWVPPTPCGWCDRASRCPSTGARCTPSACGGCARRTRIDPPHEFARLAARHGTGHHRARRARRRLAVPRRRSQRRLTKAAIRSSTSSSTGLRVWPSRG